LRSQPALDQTRQHTAGVIGKFLAAPKAHNMFDDPACKFLKSLLFSGGCPMPKLEKGKGKKRAASVPAASVATAMDHGVEEIVALPASSGSRQSINVQVPTAILRNLQTYLEYVHAVRAEDSQPA
jgi:hypothetical protein